MSKLTEKQKIEILERKEQGFSSRAIASLVLGSSSRKSTVNDFLLVKLELSLYRPLRKTALLLRSSTLKQRQKSRIVSVGLRLSFHQNK